MCVATLMLYYMYYMLGLSKYLSSYLRFVWGKYHIYTEQCEYMYLFIFLWNIYILIVFLIRHHCFSLRFYIFLTIFDTWTFWLSPYLVLGTCYIVPLKEGGIDVLNKVFTIFLDLVLLINRRIYHTNYVAI